MMDLLYEAALAVVAAAGVLTLVRLLRGPRALDRILALDVLVTMVVAGTTVAMALRKDATPVPVLVVVSLLGFTGSVTAAHLVEKREGMR